MSENTRREADVEYLEIPLKCPSESWLKMGKNGMAWAGCAANPNKSSWHSCRLSVWAVKCTIKTDQKPASLLRGGKTTIKLRASL